MAFNLDFLTSGNSTDQLVDDPNLQAINLKRKLALADSLRNAKMPQGQMVGDRYVAPSWTQYLAGAVDKGMAGYQEDKAIKEYSDYQKTQQEKLGKALDTLNTDISPLAKQTMQDNFVDKPLEQGMNVPTSPSYSPTSQSSEQVSQVYPNFNGQAPVQNMQGNMSVNQPITSTTYEQRSPTDIQNALLKYSKAINNSDLANKYILAKAEKGLSSQTKWEKVGNNLVELDVNGKPTGNVKNYEEDPASYNEWLRNRALGDTKTTYKEWKALSTQTTPNQQSQIDARNKENAYKYGTPPSNFSVTDPNGQTHYFPNQQAANQFKQAIGQ